MYSRYAGKQSEVIECSACLMVEGGPTTFLFVERTNVGRGATNPTYSCVGQEQRDLGYVVTLISLWWIGCTQQTIFYYVCIALFSCAVNMWQTTACSLHTAIMLTGYWYNCIAWF